MHLNKFHSTCSCTRAPLFISFINICFVFKTVKPKVGKDFYRSFVFCSFCLKAVIPCRQTISSPGYYSTIAQYTYAHLLNTLEQQKNKCSEGQYNLKSKRLGSNIQFDNKDIPLCLEEQHFENCKQNFMHNQNGVFVVPELDPSFQMWLRTTSYSNVLVSILCDQLLYRQFNSLQKYSGYCSWSSSNTTGG